MDGNTSQAIAWPDKPNV
ncbi:hypothetical protein [Pantoea latae]|nr:hypothetical protein [Pantoea latae]